MLIYNHDDIQKRSYPINATVFIVTLQIIIFVCIFFIGQSTCLLYKLGSKYTPAIRYEYQFHRLLIPIMLHASVSHLAMNSISTIMLCYPWEIENGRTKFLILYFLSGIGGNVLSAIYAPYGTSVGASGAIFGFIGFQAASMLKRKPTQQEMTTFSIIFTMQILHLISESHIDVAAHFGGFIIGSLFRLTSYNVPACLMAIMSGIGVIYLMPLKHKFICQ